MADPEEEFIRKIFVLCNQRFFGNYKMMFNHHSRRRGNKGLMDADELSEMLARADIGNALSRQYWVAGIMKLLDKNGDLTISSAEFEKYILSHGGLFFLRDNTTSRRS